MNALIGSLEKNIDILEDYKKTPEKLNNWLNKKDEYLDQVLCNLDAISSITGAWIGKNGAIFKSWIELYVLIKAVLKSWQALIDIFFDYEAECHTCKNERQDLLDYEFKLISFIIPKIPVIQFPKWPDIILDLHNIRAGIILVLPEFNINSRPILLPPLPPIHLPVLPTVNIMLPSLQILPVFDVFPLPDLPTLPTVILPDLPPPPKLPQMFGSFQ